MYIFFINIRKLIKSKQLIDIFTIKDGITIIFTIFYQFFILKDELLKQTHEILGFLINTAN